MVCANAWYLSSILPLVCYGTECFSVLKRQVSNEFKWQQKTWKRPPIKRWESGLLRLYIAPISANLRLCDTYGVYRPKCARNQTAANQKKTKEKQRITQGTANGDKAKSREYSCDSTPKPLTNWPTYKTHASFGYVRPDGHPPLLLRWFGDWHCR